jgi:PAS domain S-box-containing protein
MNVSTGELDGLRRRITELEAENARLRATVRDRPPANEMFRAVIEASPVPIVALTREGKITVWNAAAERVFGWSADDVIGLELPFIPEDKREEHRQMRARDLTGEGFQGHEIRRRRKDGSEVDLLVSTAPVRNATGAVAGIMSVYIDISERKAVQDWLRQQAELLEQAHDAMIVWDFETTQIRYWNRAAEELYGHSKSEALARRVGDLLESEFPVPGCAEALKSSGRWSGELRHRTRDGRTILVESRQALVQRSDGGVVVLESSHDVTGRVHTEHELRATNEALRRANSDLEQFAYAAAHDLQEPLRNIAIYVQMLSQRYSKVLAKEGASFMEIIVEGAERLQALVQDLLAYSRTGAGELPESIQTDGSAVLRRVLKDLNALIRDNHALVQAPAPLPVLPLTEAHLSQLLHNLISNAIKYRRPEEPPVVRVEAKPEEGGWLLRVCDNGIGINPEQREQVFALFHRLNAGMVSGTGLGLAICKRVVGRYGGRIWATDGDGGKGTTFCVLIPRR